MLLGATLALYAPAAHFPFVEYDDPGYVRDNAHLADGLTPASAAWAFRSTAYQYNWHPLTWLSHALDVELFGLDAGRHHLVNVALHALNAALFFLAFVALSARVWPSAFAAALFALHPLRVESVAWIAERKDVLAGTFFALVLLAYARHARAPSPRRLTWVALALAAGLMAKPTLVTVPFVLLLLDVWPLQRFERESARARVLEKLPLLALALVSCALTLVAQHGGGAFRVAIPLPERLANAALATVAYLRQYVWPVDLAVFYPHPYLVAPERARLAAGAAAALALALAAGLAWRARGRRPWIPVGFAWFLGMLVPMCGLLQVGTLARADRYVYLAGIGLELALAWSVAELVRARPRLLPAAVAACGAALVALALRARDQLGVWRDTETLFEHALTVTDDNFVALNAVGLAHVRKGRMDDALAHFEAATAACPGFPEAEQNLGHALYERGDWAQARAALERAIAAGAGAEARLLLAFTLAREEAFARAEEELAAAVAAAPELERDERVRGLRALLARRRAGG